MQSTLLYYYRFRLRPSSSFRLPATKMWQGERKRERVCVWEREKRPLQSRLPCWISRRESTLTCSRCAALIILRKQSKGVPEGGETDGGGRGKILPDTKIKFILASRFKFRSSHSLPSYSWSIYPSSPGSPPLDHLLTEKERDREAGRKTERERDSLLWGKRQRSLLRKRERERGDQTVGSSLTFN